MLDDTGQPRGALDPLNPAARPTPAQEVDGGRRPTTSGVWDEPRTKVEEATKGGSSVRAWLRRLQYYGMALSFVAVAALVRRVLGDALSPMPFLVFYLAWVGAAAFGGLGPGMLAAVASWLCVDFFFDPPRWPVGFNSPGSLERLVVLLVGGFAVSAVSERMRRARLGERRRTEDLAAANAALRESEERFHRLFDDDLTGDFLCTVEGQILLCNPAFAAIFGYASPADAVGGNMLELYVDSEERKALLQTLAQQGKVGQYEGWRKRRDGRTIHVVENLVGHFNDRDELCEVQGYIFDDTERKEAEDRLARSERQHRLLFETMVQGVVYQDQAGRILSMNPAAERILGKTPAEFLGQTSVSVQHETLRGDGSPFPGVEHPAMVALRTGQEVRNVVMGVYNPRERMHRWIDIAAVPLFRPTEDRPYQVYTCFNDITERKRAEEALRELTATLENKVTERTMELQQRARQLEEAWAKVRSESEARIAALELLRHEDRLKTVGRLASGIAHELGTPLNVISGYAGMIAGGGLSSHDITESALSIKAQSERIAGIVRQILDFARRRQGLKAAVDLRHLARQTLDLIAPVAQKQNVKLILGESDTPAVVTADIEQIRQVLLNLVTNAVQAMPQGGDVTVAIDPFDRCPSSGQAHPGGQYVCVSVQDEGEGISEENLGRIFEPFFTTKGPGKGTGLGLAIADGIIREHGGWIAAESKPGEGSRFCIYLPKEGEKCQSES